ncbi:tail-sheath stabilizer [Acinetobacter phage SH-Ab 15599]|nr:tail-sheath stabilizer [Acinetobacter phage SH-Ab 15599]
MSNQFSLFADGHHIVEQSQLSRYSAIFGALFSGFKIRLGGKEIPVPIRFANGNVRNKGDTQLNDSGTPKAKPTLPAMAFTFGSIQRDGSRQTVDHARVKSASIYYKRNTAFSKSALAPSPYNVDYVLTVRTNTTTEALLIFEQIESAFAKGVNVRVLDSSILDVTRVINIRKHPSMDLTDNFEDMDQTRIVEFNLMFTLKGYLYNSIDDVPVVLQIDTNLEENKWITTIAPSEDVELRSLKQVVVEDMNEHE